MVSGLFKIACEFTDRTQINYIYFCNFNYLELGNAIQF